jgi:hypothetical protein
MTFLKENRPVYEGSWHRMEKKNMLAFAPMEHVQ